MNRIILFVLIALCAACAARKDKPYISVAFYNCENFFDTADNPLKNDDEFTPTGKNHYTQAIYKQKLHNIATVLQQMADEHAPNGPAIVGLAEVENVTVLDNLVHQPEIASRNYRYILIDGPDARGINVALLYDPSVFQKISAKPIPVDLKSIDTKSHTRDILHVYGILNGDTMHVFVNHWASRAGGSENERERIAAAKVCRDHVNTVYKNTPHANIIVMGDLNDDPDNASVATALGAGEDMNGALYNPWLDIYRRGAGTLQYQHHWDLFDQIIVSPQLIKTEAGKLHFEKAMIFNKDFLVSHSPRFEGSPHRSYLGSYWLNGYSDHFPVMIYLSK